MQNAICIVWLLNHLIQETKLLVQEIAFKAKYPTREDFQGAWLLYRVY